MALTTACTVSVSIYQPPCHDEELGAMAVLVVRKRTSRDTRKEHMSIPALRLTDTVPITESSGL